MTPLAAPKIVPEGVYRIHSLLFPDFCLEQPLVGDGVLSLVQQNGGKANEWEISAQETKYRILNSSNSCMLGVKAFFDKPKLTFPACERNALPTFWTIEPRHDEFVIGAYGDERVITHSVGGGEVFLSNLDGTKQQRWILEIVSLKSPGEIDLKQTYVIKNRVTAKSLLVRSTYGSYSLHITSYFDPNRNGPDYLKWVLSNSTRDGGIHLKNVRFNSLWAGESFQVSEEPASYRFIPVPGGRYFFISPENKSAPPRVAQDSSSVSLDIPMPTAILDETNPFQMWELIPQ